MLGRILSLITVLVLAGASTQTHAYARALQPENALRACASLDGAVLGQSAALTPGRAKEKCTAQSKWTVEILVALNTPVAMTDDTGNTINRTVYSAWGEIEEQVAHGNVQAPWQLPSYNPDITGQAALLSNDGQSIGFVGYRKDEATGMYYAGARWYDPLIGGFNAMDPWAGDNHAPITFNKQLYGRANPLIYIDPDGRVSFLTTARDWFNDVDKTMRTYATYIPMFSKEIGAVRGVTTLASLPVRATNLASDAIAQAIPGQTFQGAAEQGSVELGKTLDEVVPLAVAYAQNPEGTKALMAIHMTKAASNTVVAAASGDGGAVSDITSTAVQFGLPIALEPVLAAKLANFGGKANQVMQSADDVMRLNAQAAARQAQSSARNQANAVGEGAQAPHGVVSGEMASGEVGVKAPPSLHERINARQYTGDKYRDSAGRLRYADGRYAEDGAVRAQRAVERSERSEHGNTAGDQNAYLYARYDADGNFQKWGITQDLNGRYTDAELAGGRLVQEASGPRREILKQERELVETCPGPLNCEPWAGKRQVPEGQ